MTLEQNSDLFWIIELYVFNTSGCLRRLEDEKSEWADSVVGVLKTMSPTSLKVTKKALEIGAQQGLSECLKIEYRLACACLRRDSDFYEGFYFYKISKICLISFLKAFFMHDKYFECVTGIRALLIDKDQKPVWNPRILSEVTEEYVNQRFSPLPSDLELVISKL